MTQDRRYYKLMLGAGSAYADECIKGNFVGVDFDIEQDLSQLSDKDWENFNQTFIPELLKKRLGRPKPAAGRDCSMLRMFCQTVNKGDIVLCPDKSGKYAVGEITGEQDYKAGRRPFPHIRSVDWRKRWLDRRDMSKPLQGSTQAPMTILDISRYREEIEALINGEKTGLEETGGGSYTFSLEKHLEHFLVENWDSCELGKKYDIYEADGQKIGQQYHAGTGCIDILAISKDKKELLVVELKKGRASDSAIGQVLRYMGYLKSGIAEAGQSVRGCIIASEDHPNIRLALHACGASIDFYQYEVSFKLKKV